MNEQTNQDKQSVQNDQNHALNRLNEAAHNEADRDQDVQEAKEGLYDARLERLEQQASDLKNS